MPIIIENAPLLCNSCGIDLGSVRPDDKVTQFLNCNNCDKARKFHSEHAFLQTWDEDIFLEAFADFTLESCDGGIVRAHKAVLAGKSKVFKAMLMAGMSECVSGRVKISDMTAEELHSLIDFLYRGSVNKKSLECHGVALYRASVKYDLPLLTAKCECFLENNVFTDVRGVFQLATDYGVEKFQKAVLPFIFSLGFVHSNCPAVVMKTLRGASNFVCFAAYRKKNCNEVPLILETAFYRVADYCDNLHKAEEERNVVLLAVTIPMKNRWTNDTTYCHTFGIEDTDNEDICRNCNVKQRQNLKGKKDLRAGWRGHQDAIGTFLVSQL